MENWVADNACIEFGIDKTGQISQHGAADALAAPAASQLQASVRV